MVNMIVKLVVVLQFLGLILEIKAETCKTANNELGECVLIKSCPPLLQMIANRTPAATEYVRKSICGFEGVDSKVCCGSTSSADNTNSRIEEKQENNSNNKHLLPDRRFCGYQHFDDYGHTTNETGITESPWLARLGYKDINKDGTIKSGEISYSCAGSIINTRYILTAAACVSSTKYGKLLVEIQLGEYNIRNKTDCVQESTLEECSDPVRTYEIEKVIPHPQYNRKSQQNDIALIRLKTTVAYSDYIRPICLPYPGTHFANIGDVLVQAGFGLERSGGDVAVIKKRVRSRLISNEECVEAFKEASGLKLDEKMLCTRIVENSTQISCRGDFGAPVTFSHRLQWHQEGILSFGQSPCDLGVPGGHTRVEKYLNWIEENVEP